MAVYTMKGSSVDVDVLDVFEDHLTITHKGAFGIVPNEKKKTKIISFSSISSIQFKKAGFLYGYLHFKENESKVGYRSVMADEKTFLFAKNNFYRSDVNKEVEKIKDYIELQITRLKDPQYAQTFIANTVIESQSTQLENPQNAKISITNTDDEQKKLADNLINCKDCGKKVSPNADNCPHCGAPFPKKPFRCKTIACKMFFIGIILICLVWVVPLFLIFLTLLAELIGL